ncbi:MAG: hypothetical protein ACYDCN_09610 [Bacteroidia bacterium]
MTHKKPKKEYYLAEDDNGKEVFLNNFSSKLPTYAVPSILNLDAAIVTQTEHDAENFAAIIAIHAAFKKYLTNITKYKNHMRDGAVNDVALPALAAPPALIAFVGIVVGDIFGRIRKLVQTIKNHPKYTEAMGADLGIIGAEPSLSSIGMQRNELKPIITVKMQSGHPHFKWKKHGLQGVKAMVDRGTGEFKFLATDTKTIYLDTFALPAIGASAVWKYMFIYIENDEEIGQWSDVISVPVGGVPTT